MCEYCWQRFPLKIQEDLERIEEEWSFEELKIVRELVMGRMVEDEKAAKVGACNQYTVSNVSWVTTQLHC